MEIFVGRQPIFTSSEQIFGYELLYRNGNENSFPEMDADQATIAVLNHSFLTIGMDELSNRQPCFINFTENLLMQDVFSNLNPKEIVIEVLEDVPITQPLLNRLRELKELGFSIALDDFTLNEHILLYDELFSLVHYIKVDFLESSETERWTIEQIVKNDFPHITLLAEKIETREDFEVAKDAGYDLYQGYFFAKPQIISGRDIPPTVIPYFKIINLVNEKNPSIDKITQLIEHDISLTYKLLKIVNSPVIGLRTKVRSIKQVIMLLGLKELEKWIFVMALRETVEDSITARHKTLMDVCLLRAKLCEEIAKQQGAEYPEEYFLTGMFSMIDVLLQRPMDLILSKLPLSEEVSNTINGIETDMTPYLKLVIAMEQLDYEQIDKLSGQFNLKMEQLQSFYNNAYAWSKQIN